MKNAYASFPSSGNGETAEIMVGGGADAVAIIRVGRTADGSVATVLDSTVGDVDLASLIDAMEHARSIVDPSPTI